MTDDPKGADAIAAEAKKTEDSEIKAQSVSKNPETKTVASTTKPATNTPKQLFSKSEMYATLIGLSGYVLWIFLFIFTGPSGLFFGIFAPFFAYMISFSYFRNEFVKSMIISFGIFIVFLIAIIVLIKSGVMAVPGLRNG